MLWLVLLCLRTFIHIFIINLFFFSTLTEEYRCTFDFPSNKNFSCMFTFDFIILFHFFFFRFPFSFFQYSVSLFFLLFHHFSYTITLSPWYLFFLSSPTKEFAVFTCDCSVPENSTHTHTICKLYILYHVLYIYIEIDEMNNRCRFSSLQRTSIASRMMRQEIE